MTHIHVNKELTDNLESQGYHLVDKHQLARMQALEKVAEAAEMFGKSLLESPEFVRLVKVLVGSGVKK